MSRTTFIERSMIFMPSSSFIIDMMSDFAEQYLAACMRGEGGNIEDMAKSYYLFRTTIEAMDKTSIELLPKN